MQCSRREWTVEAVHTHTHRVLGFGKEVSGKVWVLGYLDATGETGGQTQVQVQVQVAGRCICGAGSAHAYIPQYNTYARGREVGLVEWIS